MGNVTVSVNQKSLSRGCTVFIENEAWVVLLSVILRAVTYRTCRTATVLKAERNCRFYFRLPHFILVEIQRKLSGHEEEKFEFDLRNFGSRDAA